MAEQFQLALAPRERLPVYEWAAKHLSMHGISRPGLFDVSTSRHFIAVFDAWQNDYRREINVLKPVRGGGSLIGDVICPFAISQEPGPYMEVFQTEAEVDKYNETRTVPNFRTCVPVASLFPGDRHKVRDNEILFTTGHPWYGVGPAISNLQTKSIRYLRLEEVWMWDQGKMNEAIGRIGDYLKLQTSKVLCISQGGPMDGVPMEESDWYRHYHRGQINEWEAQCPGCLKYFDAVFSGKRADGSFYGITWNKHQLPGGDWDIGKCVPTVRFECPHCAVPILDGPRTKSEWNRTGRYRRQNSEFRIQNPEGGKEAAGETPTAATGTVAVPGPPEIQPKRESFHWEAVIDFPWDELVELWLDACNAEKRGNLGPKLQFYQKRRAMFKDEESLLKGGLNLVRSAYEINSEWPEEKARFLTLDRQEEDLLWWTVRAWSNEKSRRLGFGKCFGFAAAEELRIKFNVRPRWTFCDSGFLPKGDHGVYAACLKYGWVALRGDKEYAFPHRQKNRRAIYRSYSEASWGDPESGSGNRRYCPLIRFSKPQMNQKVQELIDSGAWEEPLSGDEDVEKEYNAQMAARVKKTEYLAKTGETKMYWKESKNDHARDLANMQVFGAVNMELVPDPATERLSASEKKEQTA